MTETQSTTPDHPKRRKFKKIMRIALVVILILTVLTTGLGIAAYYYVNAGAPTDKELNDRIAFLREKIRPKFPPEDDRRPLYEEFVKGIDQELAETAENFFNVNSDDKENEPLITADNVSDYDAFCESVDVLMENFKKVLKRPSFQFIQEYNETDPDHLETDVVMKGLLQYRRLLKLRAEIALFKADTDKLIQCFRDLSEIGIDYACRGRGLQQPLGASCWVMGQKY